MRLIITVALFLWILRKNRQNEKQRVDKLNEIVQIQIAELEAQANEIHKRLGMELHDDVAGRLVSLVHHIEFQLTHENDHQVRQKLLQISTMVREAYASIRLKSHEWYRHGAEREKTIFSDRVRRIVESILPAHSFNQRIEIDEASLQAMPTNVRIQLLRIIQEVLTNILKHAQANQVKLFIYEDEGMYILQVSDNGRGFDIGSKPSNDGLGLATIKDRIEEIRGSMSILSAGSGTELTFSIPAS